MPQRFYDVPIDGGDYLCDNPPCPVVIFICHVGGCCPECEEVGKIVRNENYPLSKEIQK
jgi:hypothetical protein